MFLGHSKVEYFSAVGNTIFPYSATITIIIAASTGLTILIAQNLGAKNHAVVKDYMYTSIQYSTILSLALFVLWFFFSESIFSLMGVDKNLLVYCVGYVRILSFSLIFLGVDTCLHATLQGCGYTNPIMYAGISKVILNILLDWSLIFGNLGFRPMGIEGAALATTISNIFGTCILFLYILNSERLPIQVKLSEMIGFKKFDSFKNVLRIGLPTGFESFVWYIGVLVMIRTLNTLDNLAVGIYTLVYGIDIAVFSIYNGIARASLTLIGNKIGEANEKGAKKILSFTIKLNLALVSIIFLVFFVFVKQILGIFTTDAQMIEKATFFFIMMTCTLFPRSLNTIVGSGIRAFGDTKWMLYTQIFGTIFVVTASLVTVFVFRFGILGIYLTILMDESIRAIYNTLYFYKRKANTEVNSERLLA